MYVTLMPVILAGIFNMIFVKSSWCKRHAKPMDRGRCLKDGRRILGENKTWIGFAGMIFFTMILWVIWGAICGKFLSLGATGRDWNYLYEYQENTLFNNLLFGAAFGGAYMICELPNSFVKRRIGILPGKTQKSLIGSLFFVVDQVDSLLGVTLVLACLYPMPLWQYFAYILLGAGTHVAVNFVLYTLKIRRNL